MGNGVIQPGERILKEEPGVIWVKSWFARPRGRLCFTTQRLFFEIPRPVAYSATQAIANEITNHVPIDIPRDALEAVDRGKHRKNDNVLIVRTEHETYKLVVVSSVTVWKTMLRSAMQDDKAALQELLDRLKPKEPPPPYR